MMMKCTSSGECGADICDGGVEVRERKGYCVCMWVGETGDGGGKGKKKDRNKY